ncbi:transketolase, partial [Vibrio parahaemolyticus V14/01]
SVLQSKLQTSRKVVTS